ncbi:MAG: ribosomal protein L11 methyltransferase [Chitinophagaceae bacterium]
MNYIKLEISAANEALQNIAVALLSENGYDGFETTENFVYTYIDEDNYSEHLVKKVLQPFQLTFTASVIEQQNWNEVWESNFEPVIVDDFVGVRANFHAPIQQVQHEIIITPKMSFGTGHHATTFTVMQLMQEIDFKNKSVIDFGTGTGILAILAEKLGATEILAIDNDDWCIENSIENIQTNFCKNIQIKKADTASTEKKYDIVIANINKNIILDNLVFLHKACKENSTIILSGLLTSDEKEIIEKTSKFQWQHITTKEKNNWIALKFIVKTYGV